MDSQVKYKVNPCEKVDSAIVLKESDGVFAIPLAIPIKLNANLLEMLRGSAPTLSIDLTDRKALVVTLTLTLTLSFWPDQRRKEFL